MSVLKIPFTFRMNSLANGNILIEMNYRLGIPGVLTRMAIATEISDLLNKKIHKVRRKKPKVRKG